MPIDLSPLPFKISILTEIEFQKSRSMLYVASTIYIHYYGWEGFFS